MENRSMSRGIKWGNSSLSNSLATPIWSCLFRIRVFRRRSAPRLMLPLSLSYDHRVIDGALAARFTAYLVNVLSDIRRTLL